MATGLNIRDFTKVYREVRYENSGSIRLTEIEHNAYVQRLTLEVTHYDAGRAINYKTLPENTHWGYLTSFKGSSVLSSTAVKFAKQRVFECINQGIWTYHQSQENIWLITSFVQKYGNLALGELSSVGDGIGVVGVLINALEGLEVLTEPAFAWVFEEITGNEQAFDNPSKPYSAFPITSPFPDVFKFKSDIPASFLMRLESWYLVNPAVYITSNPTDTSDETEGEDEYPQPQAGDGNGGGENFPEPSEPDPNSDSRDFTEGDFGDQGTWSVNLKYFDAGNNPPCNEVPIRNQAIAGYSKTKPYLDVVSEPGPFGSPAVDLVTALQRLRVANDCGVRLEGEPTFQPGQVVFP